MLTKRCSKCGEVKAADLFSRDASRKDGRQAGCKACRALYKDARSAADQREWRAANKEKCAAYPSSRKEAKALAQKRFYEANRGKCAAWSRAWRDANRTRVNRRARERLSANRDSRNRIEQQRRIELGDNYVKRCLTAQLGVKRIEVTPELVELKKLQLKAKRTCRAIHNLTEGNDHE